jgi:hypothetical protein
MCYGCIYSSLEGIPMSEYLGFIALIPRQLAHQWLEGHMARADALVLQAFASDEAWEADQPVLPALGRRLALNSGGIAYTAWQYTAQDGDVLALACHYVREWIGPGGKFAADVELHEGQGVMLIEIVGRVGENELDIQMKRALLRV